MMESSLVQVGIGAVQLGRDGVVLSALLGSCIGIGLLWTEGRCCALAHCLLPEAPATADHMGARYVNHAVPALLAMMGVRTRDRHQVRAVLAGGARMLGRAGISSNIGQQNIAAARSTLAAHGLTLATDDTGGRHGRTIRIDCTRHCVDIRLITSELIYAGT